MTTKAAFFRAIALLTAFTPTVSSAPEESRPQGSKEQRPGRGRDRRSIRPACGTAGRQLPIPYCGGYEA